LSRRSFPPLSRRFPAAGIMHSGFASWQTKFFEHAEMV
jgi:hypothetical protein